MERPAGWHSQSRAKQLLSKVGARTTTRNAKPPTKTCKGGSTRPPGTGRWLSWRRRHPRSSTSTRHLPSSNPASRWGSSWASAPLRTACRSTPGCVTAGRIVLLVRRKVGGGWLWSGLRQGGRPGAGGAPSKRRTGLHAVLGPTARPERPSPQTGNRSRSRAWSGDPERRNACQAAYTRAPSTQPRGAAASTSSTSSGSINRTTLAPATCSPHLPTEVERGDGWPPDGAQHTGDRHDPRASVRLLNRRPRAAPRYRAAHEAGAASPLPWKGHRHVAPAGGASRQAR